MLKKYLFTDRLPCQEQAFDIEIFAYSENEAIKIAKYQLRDNAIMELISVKEAS